MHYPKPLAIICSFTTHTHTSTHTQSHTHTHMLHINIQQTLRSSGSRPHHLPALIVTINYLAITDTHTHTYTGAHTATHILPYTHARAGQYISIGLG